MGLPSRTSKAWANSGKLLKGPLTRNFPGLCGSICNKSRIVSRRGLFFQFCAPNRKKRCCGADSPIFLVFFVSGFFAQPFFRAGFENVSLPMYPRLLHFGEL